MSDIPEWGTPPSPQPEPGAPAGAFVLVVEQLTGSGESAVWRVDPPPIPAGHTREQARAAAYQLAFTFRPRHPFSPRGRNVFRQSDDSLVVLVEGATKTFHFRVSVAEFVGAAPG